MVCLANEPRSFYCFEIADKYCILDTFLIMRATPFLLMDSLPIVVDIMAI